MAPAPELLPEAEPVLAPGLAALAVLSAFIVAWGLVTLIDAIVRMLFGVITFVVRRIPFAGLLLDRTIHTAERIITNQLGKAEQKFDQHIAESWHTLGRVVRHVGRELEWLAYTIFLASAWIVEKVDGKTAHAIAHRLTVPLHVGVASLRAGQRWARGRAQALETKLEHNIYPRLRAAELAIEHVLEPEYESLRERAKALEHGLANLQRWIRGQAKTVASLGFIAAVAFALARLGGGWIRCSRWNKIGKKVCGNDLSFLEDLLGLSLALLAVVDPVAIAKTAIVTEDAADSIIRKIAELHDPVT